MQGQVVLGGSYSGRCRHNVTRLVLVPVPLQKQVPLPRGDEKDSLAAVEGEG